MTPTTPLPANPAAADDRLQSVALPLLERDIGANLESLLALWADDRFLPVLDRRTHRPHLMVVANNATPERLAEAEALLRAFPRLARCFSGFSAHSAGLEGDRDLYVRGAPAARDGSGRPPAGGAFGRTHADGAFGRTHADGAFGRTHADGAFGTRAGPNFLFHKTMELARAHGGYTLQLETDCLPVQAGWIEATQDVIGGNARAWVIGSVYAGRRGIGRAIQTHLNGNAVYKAGDPAFQTFLADVWMAGIRARIRERPDLPYDCWWALERHRADAASGNDSWLLYQTYDSFFRNDPFIVNLLVQEEGLQDYARVFEKFTRLGRMPVFFHGPAMKDMPEALHAHPRDSMLDALDRRAPPRRPRQERRRLRAAGPGSGGAPDGAGAAEPGEPAPRRGAGGDFLDRLAARATADEDGAAELLLRACTAALLLAPETMPARFAPQTELGRALAAARSGLGEEHALCAQFARACARARLHDPAAGPTTAG